MGYPLKAAEEFTRLVHDASAFTGELLNGLEQDDADRCAAAAAQFTGQIFLAVNGYLHAQGMQDEELRAAPSITFSPPEA